MAEGNDREGPDFEALLRQNPDAHTFWAQAELQHGRTGCLAEHIRRSDLRIHPDVARELLALLDGSNPDFELSIVRRSGAAPASKSKIATLTRDAQLTMAVGELSGFKPGRMKSAFEDVGKAYGLSAGYVRKRVRRFRSTMRER